MTSPSASKIRMDLPFGEPLGTAPGGVISYSSDYKSADSNEYPDRRHFRSYHNGIYMGVKWQCVEFARRWLYVNKGYIFDDVAMAYDIFQLRSVRDLTDNTELPINSFSNGSVRHPEPGCLLIWDEGGHFEETGHVAIITEVFPDKIRIVEQNMDFHRWPEGQNYAREIKAKIGSNGDYWLNCPSIGSHILGWVIQTSESDHSVEISPVNKEDFNVSYCEAAAKGKEKLSWLNIANEDENAYVEMMGGQKLASTPVHERSYFEISSVAKEELEAATDELHQMFMHATDYVLERPELLEKFGLPNTVMAKIQQSWSNRKNQLITSRFDFAMSEQGLKVYEYNCDSASCYMEVGKIQGKWLKHFEIKGGTNAGSKLFVLLVNAWKQCEIDSIVHVLQDDDPEETYHALFMKSAIEAAGYECELITGLSTLRINGENAIEDSKGNVLKWVWKTWAWETALDELRFDDKSDEQAKPASNIGEQPLLSDVLLNDAIMVFEPLWTLIPSNKAILPILWTLFPNHRYLLNTEFTLTSDLLASGYVAKPIVGRCGANIQLVDHQQNTLAEKSGMFEDRTQIYQQLFPLPLVNSLYVQVCTFTAQGNYAGSGVRVDESMIIGKDSDCLALQIKHPS